jgi:hypothetical protein
MPWHKEKHMLKNNPTPMLKKFVTTKVLTVIYVLVFLLINVFIVAPPVSAATTCSGVCKVTCKDKTVATYDIQRDLNPIAEKCSAHGGISTVGAPAAEAGSGAPAATSDAPCVSDPAAPNGCTSGGSQGNCKAKTNPVQCLFNNYINPLIALLSALVGIFVVIGIVTGGIMYTSSAGDPQKAAAAKGRIIKVLIALVAYAFLYAFIQFILPGGLNN